MRLGTLKRGGRDGTLVVVSRDLSRAVTVSSIAPTLQGALDSWSAVCDRLRGVSDDLNAGRAYEAFALHSADLAPPLPRAYQWLDGSAYLNHVELVRRARGASLPPSFQTEPIMYQGGSDTMVGPHDLRYGDRVRIEMRDRADESVFGAIDQRVEPCMRVLP